MVLESITVMGSSSHLGGWIIGNETVWFYPLKQLLEILCEVFFEYYKRLQFLLENQLVFKRDSQMLDPAKGKKVLVH